jgi:calcineurin-like phosphoesterase family protein
VKSEDLVFVLGDFCFRNSPGGKLGNGTLRKSSYWQALLNGSKIFIRGNHDKNNSTKTLIDCVHITYANQRINLCHNPEHANADFPINLVGHVHQRWVIQQVGMSILYNVGVDVNRFMPVTIDEVLGRIVKWKKDARGLV